MAQRFTPRQPAPPPPERAPQRPSAANSNRFMSSAGLLLQQLEQQSAAVGATSEASTSTEPTSHVSSWNTARNSHLDSNNEGRRSTEVSAEFSSDYSADLNASAALGGNPINPITGARRQYTMPRHDPLPYSQRTSNSANGINHNNSYNNSSNYSRNGSISTLSTLSSMDDSIDRFSAESAESTPAPLLPSPTQPAPADTTNTPIRGSLSTSRPNINETALPLSSSYASSPSKARVARSTTSSALPTSANTNDGTSLPTLSRSASLPPTSPTFRSTAPNNIASTIQSSLHKYGQRLSTTSSASSSSLSLSLSIITRERPIRVLQNAIDKLFKNKKKLSTSTGKSVHTAMSANNSIASTGTNNTMNTLNTNNTRRKSIQQRPFVGRTKSNDEEVMRAMSREAQTTIQPSVVSTLPPPRSWIVVSGPSGSGKSTIFSQLLHNNSNSTNASDSASLLFIIRTRLSKHHVEEPLSSVRLFLQELMQQIVVSIGKAKRKQELFQQIKYEVSTNLKLIEKQVLLELLLSSSSPQQQQHQQQQYESLLGCNAGDSHRNDPSSNATSNGNNNQHQLQNAIIMFLTVLSASIAPIVWICENVQYCDTDSYQMMMYCAILQQQQLSVRLAIMTSHDTMEYHDHDHGKTMTTSVDVTNNTNLSNMLQALEHCKRTRSIRLVPLSIDNFTMDQTKEWFLDGIVAVRDDGTTTNPQLSKLAEYLHEMTDGNVFYLEQYLRSLIKMELFKYDTIHNEWVVFKSVAEIRSLMKKRTQRTSSNSRRSNNNFISSMDWMKYQMSGVMLSPTTTTLASLSPSPTTSLLPLSKHVLSMAACLGSNTFTHSMIQLVVNGFANTAITEGNDHDAFFQQLFQFPPSNLADSTKLNSILKVCQEQGWIIEQSTNASSKMISGMSMVSSFFQYSSYRPDKYYAFVHENVQSAALSLLPENRLSELQFRIGDILLNEFVPTFSTRSQSSKNNMELNGIDEDDGGGSSSYMNLSNLDQSLLFLLVNLLNTRLDMVPSRRNRSDSAKRFQIAQLNHQAGKISLLSCCSYIAAGTYFRTAISLLPHDHWGSGGGSLSQSYAGGGDADVSQSLYAMSLDLYSSAAECARMNGNYEQMKLYCQTVIELDEGSGSGKNRSMVLDKMKAYHVLIDASLQAQQAQHQYQAPTGAESMVASNSNPSHSAAMTTINTNTSTSSGGNGGNSAGAELVDVTSLGLDVLSRLGLSFPKGNFSRSLSTMRGLFNTKLSVDRITQETIRSLAYSHPMDDPMHDAIMKTLDKVTTAAYSSKPDFMPLVVLKSVRRTLDHGITMYSPPAFAMLGLILTYFVGEFTIGKTYADHAISMTLGTAAKLSGKNNDKKRRHNSKSSLGKSGNGNSSNNPRYSTESRTMYTCYGMVLNWTQPWETCREPLLDAYHSGMAAGDVESAMWSMYYYLDMSWNTGSSLIALDRDFSTYTKLCQDTKQGIQNACLAMNWQVILNLRGLSAANRRTVLAGDAFDERIALQQYKERGNVLLQLILNRYKLYAAFFFGEFEVACVIGMDILDDYLKKLPGQTGCICALYMSGLAAVIVSKSKGKDKKYKRYFRKCRTKLKEWADKGNPNCAHYVAILDGEHDTGRGLADAASKHFELAIRLTGRRGLIQDQAFANERLAESWLYHGDSDNAKYHFEEALRLYGEWGADRKVELLQQRCQKVWRN